MPTTMRNKFAVIALLAMMRDRARSPEARSRAATMLALDFDLTDTPGPLATEITQAVGGEFA